MFQSSLPLDRVLEDPYDLPPVILCYKLNGQWLTPERGGPVRMVVPEAYGFKSIKWLQRIVISNLFHANDTYADGNNDVDSRLKTWAATLSIPTKVIAGSANPSDRVRASWHFGTAKGPGVGAQPRRSFANGRQVLRQRPWKDADILPPPAKWGGGLAEGKIPAGTLGFEEGKPVRWPLRLTKVHWATLLDGLQPGQYTFRSRTIDEKGIAQPLPRPFRKSGHAAIEQVHIDVEA